MLINRIKRLINKKGDVPILAVTAFDDRTRRLELFHFGVDDYLIKPLIDEDLLFRIQSLITRKQLKQQDEHNQLARLIYQHSSEGMMVTDENNQIIAVNPAFTDITGFTEAEVFGKTPSVLSSQAHDNEFFKNLWHDLHLKGEWSGEIWNKRKNGQKFLAWMNINTLKDKNNLIYRYIAIFTDITSRIKADAIVLQEANFDSLTALPNRRLLKQYVEQAIKQAKREHQNFALLFIDLDDFKPLNENYSHNFGDKVLTAFSKRMRALLRDSDIVARYGGDEFVVVIYQFESIGNLNNIVHKLQQGLEKNFLIDEIEINLSASIGISLYPNNGQHFDQLIKQADQAMYHAKKMGKKQCCYYESSN
jgi:diguanylate cyclase (GGDEF)-like protein/PAS domain S-box-containing protein